MSATIKIKFDLTAGFLCRDRVKQDLENSKAKLKHWYPDVTSYCNDSVFRDDMYVWLQEFKTAQVNYDSGN